MLSPTVNVVNVSEISYVPYIRYKLAHSLNMVTVSSPKIAVALTILIAAVSTTATIVGSSTSGAFATIDIPTLPDAECIDSPATIAGTDGADTIHGTEDRDIIAALGG